jgi:hypothetical protein
MAALTWASASGVPVAVVLPLVGRLQNHVFLMAVDWSGEKALAGDLLVMGGRDEDVKPPAGAAADLIGAVEFAHRQRQNLAILHQHHVGMENGQAQRIGDGSVDDGCLSRGDDEEKKYERSQ